MIRPQPFSPLGPSPPRHPLPLLFPLLLPIILPLSPKESEQVHQGIIEQAPRQRLVNLKGRDILAETAGRVTYEKRKGYHPYPSTALLMSEAVLGAVAGAVVAGGYKQ
jgi:hypothetical protein